MGGGLQHSSGRVIGLGRVLLGILYLLAIYADASQPARAPEAAYVILGGYLAIAIAVVAIVWDDWWQDARLAGPAHAVDILFFTVLVLLTEGYTSPFFTFFMFVLLSAAIRWGWRATALTSVLLVLLYLIAGMLVADTSPQLELRQFAVRTAHLLILSLILIWFGASRWSGRTRSRALRGPRLDDQPPLDSGLQGIMADLRAGIGAFLWKGAGDRQFAGPAVRGAERSDVAAPAAALERAAATSPFLYDLKERRSLARDSDRNLVDADLADLLDLRGAAALGLDNGLAIPVRSGDGEGLMFVEGVPGLSSDHLDLGEQIAADLANHLQAHALLTAADERAEARSRLTLARDLHDGIVQFLAGAAFRLEAMRRSLGSDRDLEPELAELKKLILQEQADLRTFIAALRAGPVASFADFARDLDDLAGRLSQQWNIRCSFTAKPAELNVSTRLQIDVHQLVREAVANAVRHADARSIRIELSAGEDALRLAIVNTGAAPEAPAGRPRMPRSLQERVEEAGGEIDIARAMSGTRVSITLPIRARPR